MPARKKQDPPPAAEETSVEPAELPPPIAYPRTHAEAVEARRREQLRAELGLTDTEREADRNAAAARAEDG